MSLNYSPVPKPVEQPTWPVAIVNNAAPTPVPALVTWAPVISSGLVFVVGVLAARIAWTQAYVARTKLRLDLYDKRIAIFDSCNAIITLAATTGTVTNEEYSKLGEPTYGTPYIFNRHVAAYVERLRVFAVGINIEPVFPEGQPRVAWRLKSASWAAEQRKVLREVFGPYLEIEQSLWRRLTTVSRPKLKPIPPLPPREVAAEAVGL